MKKLQKGAVLLAMAFALTTLFPLATMAQQVQGSSSIEQITDGENNHDTLPTQDEQEEDPQVSDGPESPEHEDVPEEVMEPELPVTDSETSGEAGKQGALPEENAAFGAPAMGETETEEQQAGLADDITPYDTSITSDALLRAAVAAAGPGDVIELGGSFELSSAIRITTSLTIEGNGHTLTLAPGNAQRHFAMWPNVADAAITFSNITLQGHGDAAGGGIGLLMATSLHLKLENTNIIKCINSSTYGGAVFGMQNYNFVVEVVGGAITGNSASQGGGIYNAHGTVVLRGATVSQNTATTAGGGVYCPRFVMESGTVEANNAGTTGGGVYAVGDNTITDPLTITGGSITGNTAAGAGGGIYANSTKGPIAISNANFVGNRGANGGGFAAVTESANGVTITSTLFDGNISTAAGGAVYSQKPLTLQGCTITGNQATSGGGVFSYKDLRISGGSIASNTSSGWGGGVYSITGNARISDVTITGNTSEGDAGGGIYVDERELLTLENVTFYSNSTPKGYYWELDAPGELADEAALHRSQVHVVSLTQPYTNAYNNRDVVFNWRPVEVTFVPNGGTWGAGGTGDIAVETGVGLPAYQPDTLDNGEARFKGWYLDEELTQPFTPGEDLVYEDTRVYAGWQYPQPVTFLLWDGTVYYEDTAFEGDLVSPPPAAPTREDYEFRRWSDQPVGQTWDFATDTMPDGPLVLYSIWDIDDFDVMYMVEKKLYRLQCDVDYGTFLSPPEPPTRVGHTFAGWCSVGDGSDIWDFSFDTMPDGPLVLYAMWNRNLYDVIYMVEETEHHRDTGVGYGLLLTPPEVPVKDGHIFEGWHLGADAPGLGRAARLDAPQELVYWVFESDTMPDSTLILYAAFTPQPAGTGGSSSSSQGSGSSSAINGTASGRVAYGTYTNGGAIPRTGMSANLPYALPAAVGLLLAIGTKLRLRSKKEPK